MLKARRRSQSYTARSEAYALADALRALPEGPEMRRAYDDIAALWAMIEPIARSVRADAFMIFDTEMGRHECTEGRFWMMRTLRNSPEYGPKLFAAFKR